MRSKGGNYFEFISDFEISIWDLTIVLFHETGETPDIFGTLFVPKTRKIVAKTRFLDCF